MLAPGHKEERQLAATTGGPEEGNCLATHAAERPDVPGGQARLWLQEAAGEERGSQHRAGCEYGGKLFFLVWKLFLLYIKIKGLIYISF